MAMDHSQHGRRGGHYNNRSRRGGGADRRGRDRPQAPTAEQAPRTERVDVEQIMREIRGRISQRSGVDLSNQQIQELAARRLEAVLDPRSIKPGLLDELRRSAGERPSQAEPATAQPPLFDEVLLYDSPNGLLRFLRKLLNPILRLLINPTPIAHALAVQGRLHAEAATRAADQERRQAEWNALHYEILQRLVRESARGSLEAESLAHRVESLGAKVDFNDRRVRGLEGTQVRVPRQTDASTPAVAIPGPTPTATQSSTPIPEEPGTPPAEGQSTPGSDGTRRRRRRRRGRRGAGIAAGPPMEGAPIASSTTPGETDADEGFDQEPGDDQEFEEVPLEARSPAPAGEPTTPEPEPPQAALPPGEPTPGSHEE